MNIQQHILKNQDDSLLEMTLTLVKAVTNNVPQDPPYLLSIGLGQEGYCSNVFKTGIEKSLRILILF